MPALLSVVGRKGSGKSGVLETLISLLTQKGFRVGVIKHLARDDFEIDEPRKDTYRYRARGAETVVLAGRKRLAVFSNLRAEMTLEQILNFFQGFDLVLLEGYFLDEVPKLEVRKKELGEPLLTEKVKNRFAILSDGDTGNGLPHFSFGELEGLAHFIEENLLRQGWAAPHEA